ncbi:hypothetical protein Mapa_012322 [Marchantia paleacea]|nr:hypothetical protein Mapa_012322 [Marchantia paleacea]
MDAPSQTAALVGAGIQHRENSTKKQSKQSATRTVKQTSSLQAASGKLTARERDMMEFTPSTGNEKFEDQKGLGGCRIQ